MVKYIHAVMRKASLSCWFLLLTLVLFSFIGIQEGTLFYEEAGEGETIIFVHGGQEDYSVFTPQIETLKKDFRVITYSRRFNFPNKNQYQKGRPFNPITEANDLEKLIKDLGIDNFHLVGHSYGGLIAIAYANNNLDKLKSLTVSEPPVLSIEGCEESLKSANEGLIKKVGDAFITNDSTLIMKAIFEFFVGKDIQNELPPQVITSLKANLTEMEALVNSENPFPDLNTQFNVPTLIFTSEYTMPILKCTNEMLIKNTPNAKHVKILGASHDMWMTHPEVMSLKLKEFILKE